MPSRFDLQQSAFRDRPKAKAQGDDSPSFEQQIDAEEGSDRPKPGERPAGHQQRAKQQRDAALQEIHPQTIDLGGQRKTDDEYAFGNEIEGDEKRDRFGADRRARQQHDSDDRQKNRPEHVDEEVCPQARGRKGEYENRHRADDQQRAQKANRDERRHPGADDREDSQRPDQYSQGDDPAPVNGEDIGGA